MTQIPWSTIFLHVQLGSWPCYATIFLCERFIRKVTFLYTPVARSQPQRSATLVSNKIYIRFKKVKILMALNLLGTKVSITWTIPLYAKFWTQEKYQKRK